MFSPFERMVAMRYLRARRKEGFISVIAGFSLLGIALGVATLIIVMSVMNGFRHELLGRILGLNGHLTMEAYQGPLPDYAQLTDELRKLPMVKMADPMVQGQAMVTVKDRAIGAVVRGMRPEDVKARAIIANNIKEGSLDRFHGEDVVIIGQRMAEGLGIGVGGQITLISPQSTATLIGLIPRIKVYDVVGIFEVGMSEYDSSFVFMPLEAAQLYFKMPNAASDIEITVDDPDRIATALDAIQAKIGGNYRFVDWQQANSSFFGAIQVERNVMFLILTLIIVVAAFNIISGQIMLVKDKGRDIAILRTMGATQGAVMRVFLITGSSIGVIGTIAGFILGLLICMNVEAIRQFLSWATGSRIFPEELYFLSHLPAQMDPAETIAVVVMALTLSFLATLYPSWRAARLDPVEALRYE